MKKKLLAMLLSTAMVASVLAGCGSSTEQAAAPAAAEEKAEEPAAAEKEEPAAEEKAEAATVENIADAAAVAEGTAQFEGLTANEAYDFSIIVKSFQSTYWQAAIQGMEMAAGELGVTYTAQGPNSESDIADQINMLNNAINSAPAGVGLAACDTSSVQESLSAAKAANLPIVAFDTGIDNDPDGAVVCTVATDNTAAGEVAAINMYAAIKDQIGQGSAVRVGEVNQDATALNIQQRGLGFINKFIELATADGFAVAVTGNEFYVNACTDKGDEASADVIIEVAVPAQTTVDLCATEAGTIMSKEDTIAIFGSNQTAAEGVLSADGNLSVLGDKVVGVGFDAGTIIKDAVSSGKMLGAVTQSPLMMGYYAIYALTAAANGQTLADCPTDGYWYDASNMTDELIAPNLYD